MTNAQKEKILRNQRSQADMPLNSLGQYAAALLNVVAEGVEAEAEAYNLKPLEFALLRLFLTEEEWTPTELAEVLPVEVSAISRMVTKLVDRGMLYRRRPRSDRRIVLLKLTEEGTAFILEIHRRVHAYEDSLFQGIPEEEKEDFLSTIRKILDNYASITE